MAASDTGSVETPFESFELVTAILLGLAAIGVAVAGVQGGQWNGRQSQAFAEANSITTEASKSYSEAVSDMNSDYAVVGQAKQKILEGIDAKDPADKHRDYRIASYYLTQQLSITAYEALKLPKDEEPAAGSAPIDAKASGEGSAAESTSLGSVARKLARKDIDTEEEVQQALADTLPETDLIRVLGAELHDDDSYANTMFAEGNQRFADADKRFGEGRVANDKGDEFQLAGLYYTFALFFGGLGLVFKTRMRWGFCMLGVAVLVASTGYLFTRTWA